MLHTIMWGYPSESFFSTSHDEAKWLVFWGDKCKSACLCPFMVITFEKGSNLRGNSNPHWIIFLEITDKIWSIGIWSNTIIHANGNIGSIFLLFFVEWNVMCIEKNSMFPSLSWSLCKLWDCYRVEPPIPDRESIGCHKSNQVGINFDILFLWVVKTMF